MAAYVLFDVHEITDPDKAADYRAGVFETVEAFGGQYLVLGGEVEPLEGEWRPDIPVLIRFASREQARVWHSSALYRPLLNLRQAAMRSSAVLVDGFDHEPEGRG